MYNIHMYLDMYVLPTYVRMYYVPMYVDTVGYHASYVMFLEWLQVVWIEGHAGAGIYDLFYSANAAT